MSVLLKDRLLRESIDLDVNSLDPLLIKGLSYLPRISFANVLLLSFTSGLIDKDLSCERDRSFSIDAVFSLVSMLAKVCFLLLL